VRRAIKAGLLLLTFAISIALAQQQQTGNVVGQITIANGGFPSKRLYVNIESRGTPMNAVYADDEGRFAFYELVANPYRIVITDEAFQPFSTTVIVNPLIAHTTTVRIVLTPKTEKSVTGSAQRLQGSNPYIVDPDEFTRKFPKKALEQYEKGLAAERKGKFDDAIERYKKTLEIAPGFYPAHNNLGSLYLGKGDTQGAATEFERVIATNQSDASGYLNMANLYLLTKRYDNCEQMVKEGLRRQPNSAFGKFVEGALFARTSRPADAEHALRQALQFDPQLSKVHLELVNLYLHQKRKSDAESELQVFLQTFPKDPLAGQAKEVLKRLKSSGPN
jgi:tetratricopeptide (TPR) repeat protein